MNEELTIHLFGTDHKVFLQNGFLPAFPSEGILHKHAYAEIHVIFEGCLEFRFTDQTMCLSAPALLLIPGDVYHTTSAEAGTLHSAFQIDRQADRLRKLTPGSSMIWDFLEEINAGTKTGDYTRIHAYITLLCQLSFSAPPITTDPIRDYRFLINEFFTQNYARNVQLCDLAEVLNLSLRQTERLVIAYTGNSFTRELMVKRVTMARLLQNTTQMSMTQIAQYVGYRTYAGFWKAVKKHGL